MAVSHVAVATENFMALDFRWWDDIIAGLPKPLVTRKASAAPHHQNDPTG
jgi:hypothetical protein